MSSVEKTTLIFEGHVQGVGFRAKSHQLATEIGISITAENLPDGTVKICAQGPHDRVELLISSLEKFFSISKVTRS